MASYKLRIFNFNYQKKICDKFGKKFKEVLISAKLDDPNGNVAYKKNEFAYLMNSISHVEKLALKDVVLDYRTDVNAINFKNLKSLSLSTSQPLFEWLHFRGQRVWLNWKYTRIQTECRMWMSHS